jgi:plastocyanin
MQPLMRPRGVVAALAFLATAVLAACGGGGRVRTVLIDFDHDEFAGTFASYFPRNVSVHPGDTVVFRQAWTGEPHTVTMGRLFDDALSQVPALRIWAKVGGPQPQVSDEDRARVDAAMARLPLSLSREEVAQQHGAQPCFLDRGAPPDDPERACADADQEQPAFTGRQSFYNSGIIPFEGDSNNEFTVPLAEDIAPGDYAYYCNIHGLGQSGVITVVPAGDEIPTQAQVDREARREIERDARPLLRAYEQVRAGDTDELFGRQVPGNLAGWMTEGVFGSINEFIPRRIEARVGEKVTWRNVGIHTVSFDVPDYFPAITIDDRSGTVTVDRRAAHPIGGPGFPLAAPVPGPDDTEFEVNAGEWDGDGFLSSGIMRGVGKILYSVVFTRAGTYNYACLLHPRMVGQVVVR